MPHHPMNGSANREGGGEKLTGKTEFSSQLGQVSLARIPPIIRSSLLDPDLYLSRSWLKLRIPKKDIQKKRQQERLIENQMINTANDLITEGDIETIIDFAIEANRIITQNQAELEIVKEYLRKKAVASKRSSAKTVEFTGHLGKITVTFPSPEPKSKPGVDLLACLPGLSEDVRALFQSKTSVSFAPGFTEKIGDLSERDQKVVENLLELVPSTPRVSFPEGPSSTRMWSNTSQEASDVPP